MATIGQIARELGVSTSTVSAVINKSGHVTASLRARIEKALRDADYHPDPIARSLRLGATRTIGLLVPDLGNMFYAQLMRGSEDYLASMGYRLIVADTRDEWPRQRDYLLFLSGKTTDGIILVPSMATDGQIASIPQLLGPKPLVYVDRSPLEAQVDSVLVDNAGAAFEATEHLIKLGHRRIAIITEPLNLLNAADRLAGYKQALRANRIRVDPKLIRVGGNTQGSGYWRGLDIFQTQPRPTAVLVCNNRMLLGVIEALHELGVACPDAVSLVGFDDFDWSAFIAPPLTIVRQPAAELGAAAAKTILKRILHPNRDHREIILLPTQLVVRESTRPFNEVNS